MNVSKLSTVIDGYHVTTLFERRRGYTLLYCVLAELAGVTGRKD